MPPLTRRSSTATAAGKRPAAAPANYADVVATRRARAPAAAAANEPAAGEPARPSKEAVFAIVKPRLLALSPQERAGFIEELLADDPDVLAAVRDEFADLLAEPAADTTNAAARAAAEAAAKKIEDLRAQLAAEQAKNVAAQEAAGRQAAAANEAAELAAATTASILEATTLEAQIAALHAAREPVPPSGEPNSRVGEDLALLGRPRTRPPEAAGGVSVLNQGEVEVLTRENEGSRLARYKRSARVEDVDESDDEVAASFFADQLLIEMTKAEGRARGLNAQYFIFGHVKKKAQDIGRAHTNYREL